MVDESYLITLTTRNIQATRPYKLLGCKSAKHISDYCYRMNGYIHVLSPSPPTDLAEYVLNKCITQAEPKRQLSIDGEGYVDGSGSFVSNDPKATADQSVHYNFDYLEDNSGHLKHIDKTDGEDSVGSTTVIADHEPQENGGEQISHEHHEKYIDELEPKQQIGVDGEDDVDGPAEKPDDYNTAKKPDHYNFGDRDDKDRQILHNDHSNHILDWMVS